MSSCLSSPPWVPLLFNLFLISSHLNPPHTHFISHYLYICLPLPLISRHCWFLWPLFSLLLVSTSSFITLSVTCLVISFFRFFTPLLPLYITFCCPHFTIYSCFSLLLTFSLLSPQCVTVVSSTLIESPFLLPLISLLYLSFALSFSTDFSLLSPSFPYLLLLQWQPCISSYHDVLDVASLVIFSVLSLLFILLISLSLNIFFTKHSWCSAQKPAHIAYIYISLKPKSVLVSTADSISKCRWACYWSVRTSWIYFSWCWDTDETWLESSFSVF